MVSKTKHSSSNAIIEQVAMFGRCSCDEVVKYTFYWCEDLIKKASEVGLKVIDLQNENFIEDKFKKLVEEEKPYLVFLSGHGNEFSALGFNQSPVITLNKNDYLLNGKIAHIISCSTAKFLAPCAMDKGCKGYIGYRSFFYLFYLEDNPKEDKISLMFKDAVNIASKILIEGGSVEEAFNASQKIYDERINECKGKFFHPETTEEMRDYLQDVIGALIWNKKHQVYFSSN